MSTNIKALAILLLGAFMTAPDLMAQNTPAAGGNQPTETTTTTTTTKTKSKHKVKSGKRKVKKGEKEIKAGEKEKKAGESEIKQGENEKNATPPTTPSGGTNQ